MGSPIMAPGLSRYNVLIHNLRTVPTIAVPTSAHTFYASRKTWFKRQSRFQSPRVFWSAPRLRFLAMTKRYVGSGNEIV